jgi:3-oxoacyl-[acyl-carrier protein] reductase
MDLGIRDRLALVTGASAGIGAAVALALAEEGARVAIAARRLTLLEEIAAQARRRGASEARPYALDLLDDTAVARALAEIRTEMGDPEIVILNGGGPKPGRVTELVMDDWDRAYRGTLRSMLRIVTETLPAMRRKRWGRILALTSTSVKQPIPGLALSGVFRTALVAAMKSLAHDVAADGITVNCIATGRVLTNRLRELYGSEEAVHEAARREVPIGRVATPEEFAKAVVVLCGKGAGYVTGQTVSIDGGLVSGLFG